jgi:aminoglycoside N3'-acetyltransferase
VNLSEELQQLGVASGELLMVHASLRALGLARSQGIEGGADQLLTALDEMVGPDGTLLMVLGTDYPQDAVNLRPVEERAALLAGTAPFDFRHAPVLPEVGYLAEAFRTRPGTLVSDNPSGRFGARGARAVELLRNQPWNDYYGPGSPLQRLCDWGGRILRLGANPETVTALHYAEYLARLPHKRRTRWDYVLTGADGLPEHRFIDCLNDSDGIADWAGDDYFAEIVRSHLALGTHPHRRIGNAECELLDAAALVDFGARWMEKNLASPT